MGGGDGEGAGLPVANWTRASFSGFFKRLAMIGKRQRTGFLWCGSSEARR
jgi:hypothetical protein